MQLSFWYSTNDLLTLTSIDNTEKDKYNHHYLKIN